MLSVASARFEGLLLRRGSADGPATATAAPQKPPSAGAAQASLLHSRPRRRQFLPAVEGLCCQIRQRLRTASSGLHRLCGSRLQQCVQQGSYRRRLLRQHSIGSGPRQLHRSQNCRNPQQGSHPWRWRQVGQWTTAQQLISSSVCSGPSPAMGVWRHSPWGSSGSRKQPPAGAAAAQCSGLQHQMQTRRFRVPAVKAAVMPFRAETTGGWCHLTAAAAPSSPAAPHWTCCRCHRKVQRGSPEHRSRSLLLRWRTRRPRWRSRMPLRRSCRRICGRPAAAARRCDASWQSLRCMFSWLLFDLLQLMPRSS